MPRVKRWLSTAVAALCSHAGDADPVCAIRRCADSLLADAEVAQPPVSLDLLASCRRVGKVEQVDMVEAGRLVPEGDAYVIQVNRRHPEGKRRFTVGHEICHTFFNEVEQSARASCDLATGLFDLRQEEEYLCDVGAAHILLNPRWLLPMAESRSASLDALLEIARACGASIEATAFQLAQADVLPCTFVLWEPGVQKSEHVPSEQGAFEGWEDLARPTPKLRASRVYGPDHLPFVPWNKSVDQDSTIHQALVARGRTEGREVFALPSGPVEAYCQSDYAPYYDGDGRLVQRVVSCIVWRQEERASVMRPIPGL